MRRQSARACRSGDVWRVGRLRDENDAAPSITSHGMCGLVQRLCIG
ncbi:hypothetical protein EMIT0158MI4_70308 [Burkholderia ambifaria]